MKKNEEFKHFSPIVKSFFEQLTENNSKMWFDENRTTYEKEIKNKSKLFVDAFQDKFISNNLNYIADSKLSLFRINRDIRFSKNKNPYKTNLGFFFPYSTNHHQVTKDISLGLYLHFEIDNSFVAIGIHNPDSNILKNIRTYISEEYISFFEIIRSDNFVNNFPDVFTMEKPVSRLNGFDKNHPAIEYLKRKNFTYSTKIDDNFFFEDNFLTNILAKADAGADFSNFLYKAVYQ